MAEGLHIRKRKEMEGIGKRNRLNRLHDAKGWQMIIMPEIILFEPDPYNNGGGIAYKKEKRDGKNRKKK